MQPKDFADFPLTLGPATVYSTPLPSVIERGQRRAAETEAVRRLVAGVFGQDAVLAHTSAGAPFIEGFDGSISISHGCGVALLAVSRSAVVGIDIEGPRPTLRRVAERFLSPAEFPVYSASYPLLLQAWTSKEAIFKALGIASLTIGEIILPSDPRQSVFTVHGRAIELFRTSIGDALITLAAIIGKKPLLV